MKRILLSLVMLVSGFAAADPGVTPSRVTSGESSDLVDLASSPGGFGCAPRPIGAGTFPTTRSNAAGSVAWWYCPVAGGGWRIAWAAATTEQMSVSNLLGEVRAIVAASDPNAAFAAVVAKNVKLPVTSPSLMAVWKPFAAEMVAGVPPRRADTSAAVTAVPAP